jgi:hypothetical protein
MWTAVSCWNGFQDILHSLHCYTVPLNSTVSADGANNCSFWILTVSTTCDPI